MFHSSTDERTMNTRKDAEEISNNHFYLVQLYKNADEKARFRRKVNVEAIHAT